MVYLWGAGATQGEAQHLGASVSLLMKNSDFGEGITSRILKRIGSKAVKAYGSGDGIDIEKLISLLSGSGIQEHVNLAARLRAAYFHELAESLEVAGILDNPNLAIRLLKLHKDEKFSSEVEVLSGIITTNHDGLLQVASERVYSFQTFLSSAPGEIYQIKKRDESIRLFYDHFKRTGDILGDRGR
ncbi:MAG: hypothetical protein GEU76_12115 [Alphaproteobacteria bacterium]|nr:hypothetical protein [Alphaproteobacteria bacterium]